MSRFLHIEAFGGIVLLFAAAAALIWANSPFAHVYHALWELPVALALGDFVVSQPLHFWINDGLMTVFFLVVGMEVRREMHDGALSDLRQAALPVTAAIGGVVAPALIFLAFNPDPARSQGWAVPAATDIAFAVGVLALLGRSIPRNVRILLLALAVMDDVIAVLIIAIFYSGGVDIGGTAIAVCGVAMVLGLQRIGAGSAWSYVIPGAFVWAGMLKSGIHPTLAGVLLGLMTPVRPIPMGGRPVVEITRISRQLRALFARSKSDAHAMSGPLRQLRLANREMLPPVVRVQSALHPWVAFGIMPVFALANAGVTAGGVDLGAGDADFVMFGVAVALVAGKPLGIVGTAWMMVRFGWCRLPPGVSWGGIWLVGLLAGIGFTMAIFIAMLAFSDPGHLDAAKLGVLLGSLAAALIGLAWGATYARHVRMQRDRAATEPAS